MARDVRLYKLHFDGGSIDQRWGYGSYRLEGPDLPPTVRRLRFGEGVTSNQAEYRALIAGLEDLLEHLRRQGCPPERVQVVVSGDSTLVINQLSRSWKVRNIRLRPLFQRARGLLDRFGRVELRWTPRATSLALLGH